MTDNLKRLKAIALSETGFLFDPVTGHTYTLNHTGVRILKLLRDGVGERELPSELAREFDIDETDAGEDCTVFIKMLREYRLIE